ncbi:MAG TPA: HEAT repeat domain-containing protein [Gemmatimonadaceae bacterium]|nr:HEAT repeat domain-containing protein [Gemmatimonadaceae bacterium]
MNATQALGWALVHFLWQGVALAVVLATALAVTRPSAARARYALSLATLAAMVALPIITAAHLHRTAPADVTIATLDTDVAPGVTGSPEVAAEEPARALEKAPPVIPPRAALSARLSAFRSLLDPALPWLVVLWLGGVLAFSIRLARGWNVSRSLRTQGTAPAAAHLMAMLDRVATRLRVRRPVALLESALVQVPAVVGWLRPVILVPVSALLGLPPQQLELLIAHELAHVRRYDYLVNVLQSVIETLLFYHPAVWWVSHRIREEREHCCDDLVARLCGDPHLYATALVSMERLRAEPPRLALAATGSGGSLLHRVRRLVHPGSARRELVAPWVAGVVAMTVALLAAGGARVAESSPAPSLPVAEDGLRSDTTRATADTVIQHPDPSRPLAERWAWAESQARRLDRRTYWIGYRIARPAWLEHMVYIDREVGVTGSDITISGRMFGDFEGLRFRGARLPSLLGARDSDDIAMVFGFGGDGLVRVHIASFNLPIDLASRTLFWLGDAADAESIPVVQRLMGATRQRGLREDMVGAVGIHGSSELVVPILVRWLTGTDRSEVRGQAAEWLGFHPTAAAVNALSRAARADADREVRREAAEALGDSTVPAATDSAIAIAQTVTDAEVRREAVEALGEKDSQKALDALVALARNDRNEDVQREAVEALGEMPSGRGLTAVRELARTHSNPEVQREAVETLGEHLPPAEALTVLEAIVTGDAHPDVQREAVEALGELETDAALAVITRFARSHANGDVRREAIETLGEKGGTDAAMVVLDELAQDSRDPDDAREAVESLGELGTARALERVAAIARRHAHTDVQREAIETYAEHARTDDAVKLLTEILAGEASEDVHNEVLDSLEELDGGAGIPVLVEAARAHPNREVRAEALRRLAESDDPRAKEIFERALRRP